MRKPRIKITNFKQEMSVEDIEKSIYEQNPLSDKIQVTYIKKTKTGSSIIFCECPPAVFNEIINMKKLYIGWERHPVYEDLSIPRCFTRQAFYHKNRECRNKIVCPVCSEEHKENECPRRVKKCNNCVLANNKYKLKHSIDHEASDPNCFTLNYHTQVLKNKTNYSYND